MAPPEFTDVNPRSSLRILLVDDDPTARDIALLLLDRLGCRPVAAPDGLNAVAAVTAAVYDVVLMDVQMPRMDGMEATRRIRAETAGLSRPTIIAMTADTTSECRRRCLAVGMDGHLAKPVSMAALADSLDGEVQRLAATGGRHPTDGSPGAAVPHPWGWVPGPGTSDDGRSPVHGPEPTDGPPVYDPGVLDALVAELGGDGDAMRRDLIESALVDVSERLPVMVAAGRRSDLEVLVFQSHALRSASAMVGLVALSGIASDIELRAQADPAAVDTPGQASRLVEACHRAVESLRQAQDP